MRGKMLSFHYCRRKPRDETLNDVKSNGKMDGFFFPLVKPKRAPFPPSTFIFLPLPLVCAISEACWQALNRVCDDS